MKRSIVPVIVFLLPAALWLAAAGCDSGDLKFGGDDFRDGTDDDTTYTAGPGLTETSEEFSVDFAGTGSADTVARSDHDHDSRYVLKAGDIMTGRLTLSADPTADLHAAPKQYVDARVLKSGDTMTGNLAMSSYKVTGLANPTSNQDAATKIYADARKAGTAYHGAGGYTQLSSSEQVIRTVTITTPARGYINLSASGYFKFYGTGYDIGRGCIITGTSYNWTDDWDNLLLQCDGGSTRTSTISDTGDGPNTDTDTYDYYGFTTTRSYLYNAGTYTFRFVADAALGSALISDIKLTAIFTAQ